MVDDITAHVSSQAFVQETMSKVDSSLFLAVCDVNLIEVRASDGLSNDFCRCCTNAVCIPKTLPVASECNGRS